jgi:short subunit dehydrogenase-like uncharacterized protein
MFTVPFVMAQINARVVRRSHALAGFPWGSEFIYHEAMTTPRTPRGLVMAVGIAGALGGLELAMRSERLRKLLRGRVPEPGEGPSAETRAAGHWQLSLVGTREREHLIYVASDRADPGYGSTSKMLAESALCLAFDRLDSQGGVQTPSVAMGGALLARLRSAGLEFDVFGDTPVTN